MMIELSGVQEMLDKLMDDHGKCSIRIFSDGSGYIAKEDEDILYEFNDEDDLFDTCVRIIQEEGDDLDEELKEE